MGLLASPIFLAYSPALHVIRTIIMSLTVPQLQELQTIAQTIQEQFTQNQDQSWWAAIRILNAGLGPSAGGSTFQDTLDDMKVTQGQISPYQSRLGGNDSGFTEATLQVVPSGGGGGGDNYFSANLAGTASRSHTVTGDFTIEETYTNVLVVGTLTKAPDSLSWSGVDGGVGAIAQLLVESANNGTFSLGAGDGGGVSAIEGSNTGLIFDAANQRITIQSGLTLGLPAFDDDAAADSGGLTEGQLYQTTGSGAAPLNVAGIVMQKQAGA